MSDASVAGVAGGIDSAAPSGSVTAVHPEDYAHYAGQSDGTPAVYTTSFADKDISLLTVIQHRIGFAATSSFWGDSGSGPWAAWDVGGQACVSYTLTDST